MLKLLAKFKEPTGSAINGIQSVAPRKWCEQ